ncbi:MAG: class I SAM-dependent methyltransferase [Pseudomonadota bacterium]
MLTINFKDFPVNHGDLVLDLGCGEGRHVINAYLQANIVALGVDLSLRDLTTAQLRFAPFALVNEAGTAIKATENATENNAKDNFVKQFYLQQADATCLPFGDASIDKIICSEVLEHIDNYRDVLREINRVLKPNGRLAISVPRAWPEKICWWLSAAYHENEGGHIRIFNANKLRVDIEGLGFIFTTRHWAHALHVPFWWLKCLWWKSQDKSCIIKQYHRLLVWDLMCRPWFTQTLERWLNPIMGKSVVMYFKKPGH